MSNDEIISSIRGIAENLSEDCATRISNILTVIADRWHDPKKFQFNDEEIEFMKRSATKGPTRNMGARVWSRAFQFYNTHNTPRLHPQCAPCYSKVLNFILQVQSLHKP